MQKEAVDNVYHTGNAIGETNMYSLSVNKIECMQT